MSILLDLPTPSPVPVWWRATWQGVTCFVLTRRWFEAREMVATELGIETTLAGELVHTYDPAEALRLETVRGALPFSVMRQALCGKP